PRGNEKLVASFSNYGKSTVDLFAPGVSIYSTLPDNKYGNESGTSMAAPVVAGVAAIIRSYFPALNAAQVRSLLMQQVTNYPNPVSIPGRKSGLMTLDEMSASGGIVNASRAVEAALKTAQ
ncbi:MAG: peptidase S8, partial [Sphingobacteriales bacterium]